MVINPEIAGRPQNVLRKQIDYYLINQSFIKSITRMTSYPGACIGTDYNPIIANYFF